MNAPTHCSDDLLSLAQQAVAHALKQGASAADAFAVDAVSLSASMRLGLPEATEHAGERGLGLRVFVGARSASIASDDLRQKTLDKLTEEALCMARAAPPDPFTTLAPQELLAHELRALDLCDGAMPEMQALQHQAQACEDVGRSTQGITNSEGATASFSTSTVAFASSHGAALSYQRSHASLSLSLIAGHGEDMQRDYAYATCRHRADLSSAEEIATEAAARTLAKLSPRKLPSASMPVIFDPRVGRQLAGAFASAINGAAIVRGTSFLKEAMGSAVFPQRISIIDDPHIMRSLGSAPCDDEGVRNQKRILIDQGRLTSWLLDTRSAAKLGLTSTGHAQRGVSSSPHPSPSNLYIAASTTSLHDLMRAYPRALYITETFGHGINLVTGDYSQGASGFLIEQGQRSYPVSEITIAGNLRDMFAQLHAADDLVLRYAINVPTLLVESMTVAGS